MREHLEAYKPAAPAHVHLLLAAVMWTVVGGTLGAFGLRWLVAEKPGALAWLIAIAVAVGVGKAHFVLSRTARRVIERIRSRGDGRCIGGFLSWQSWGLVVLMAASGAGLRRGILPRTTLGFLYLAIGTALMVGSAQLWIAWRASKADSKRQT